MYERTLKMPKTMTAEIHCFIAGADYLPFAEIPSLRNMVLTGDDDEDMSYMAQIEGPYAKNALPPSKGSGQSASGFRPVYD